MYLKNEFFMNYNSGIQLFLIWTNAASDFFAELILNV